MAWNCIVPTLALLAWLPLCDSACDTGAARRETSTFSGGIKSANTTLVCQTLKRFANMRSRLDSLLDTCADDNADLRQILDDYFKTAKMAPNIANFYECDYKPSTPAELVDRAGCSRSGLQTCGNVVTTLQGQVADKATASPTQIAKFCQLYNNPRLLEVCMEGYFVKCSTLERYIMRDFYSSEKLHLEQELFTTATQLGCETSATSDKTSSAEDDCQDYPTLRELLSCAPEVIAKVYSEQKIDWKTADTCAGISPTEFRECARQKTQSCPALRTLIEEVIYNVNIHCPEVSSEPRNSSTPPMAQESNPSTETATNTGSLGLPRELEVVLKELASEGKLSSWKIYGDGNGAGMSIIMNFGEGYMPQPSVCKTRDCAP